MRPRRWRGYADLPAMQGARAGRGLGAAVCTCALRRLHEEGAREAIVYSMTPPARAPYESLGLERHAAVVGYRRPAD